MQFVDDVYAWLPRFRSVLQISAYEIYINANCWYDKLVSRGKRISNCLLDIIRSTGVDRRFLENSACADRVWESLSNIRERFSR